MKENVDLSNRATIGFSSEGLTLYELVSMTLEWANPVAELTLGDLSVSVHIDKYFGVFRDGRLIDTESLEGLNYYDQCKTIARYLKQWQIDLRAGETDLGFNVAGAY